MQSMSKPFAYSFPHRHSGSGKYIKLYALSVRENRGKNRRETRPGVWEQASLFSFVLVGENFGIAPPPKLSPN